MPCSGNHSNLISSTNTCPVTMNVNSCNVSTLSYNFPYYSTASLIFLTHFLHVKFLENSGVTIFTPAILLWIHLTHCTHKTELAFTLKLQIPDRSTLLSEKPSFIMLPLTITMLFPKLTFKPLLSKASFHLMKLFMSPQLSHSSGLSHLQLATRVVFLCSYIWYHKCKTFSKLYSNSLSTLSLTNLVTTSNTTAKRKVTAQILGASQL